MKKLLYLFFAINLMGCSSDDDGTSNPSETGEQLLVKSINWTKNEGAGGNTSNGSEIFTYDGNKIVQVVRSPHTFYQETITDKYFYTNNLISRIDSYDNQQNLKHQFSYEYDASDRLIRIETSSNNQFEYFSTIEYNSNDISFTHSGINWNSETETTIYQISNDNIVSFDGNGIDANIMNCSYDNKHNPFKNIIGNNAVFGLVGLSDIQLSVSHIVNSSNQNNPIMYESSETDANGVVEDSFSYTSEYDYNDEGYPRNIVWEEVGYDYGGTIIIEYY